MPIVTERGFAADSWSRAPDAARRIAPLDEALGALEGGATAVGVDLPNDADFAALAPYFPQIALIAIAFPSFADGRGYSIAERLRSLGYEGRLRAAGPILPDQFAYARSASFDEVEISDEQAARQPQAQWLKGLDKPAGYQGRVVGGA